MTLLSIDFFCEPSVGKDDFAPTLSSPCFHFLHRRIAAAGRCGGMGAPDPAAIVQQLGKLGLDHRGSVHRGARARWSRCSTQMSSALTAMARPVGELSFECHGLTYEGARAWPPRHNTRGATSTPTTMAQVGSYSIAAMAFEQMTWGMLITQGEEGQG
jgi:hypothetical protein